MNADELDPKAVTHKSDFQDPVSVERANFSWEADNVRKIQVIFFLRSIVLSVHELNW